MKKLAILFTTILFLYEAKSQSDLTFYQMGAITPQSSMNNASFFPDAEFYFSLPGLSGLNVKMNNEISYNMLMSRSKGQTRLKWMSKMHYQT